MIDPNLGPHFKLGRAARDYVDFVRTLVAFREVVRRHASHHRRLAPHTALLLSWAYVQGGRRLDGIQWLVEKTPSNERHADTLAAHFRQARFLHVVRDPRAIYRSHLRLGELYPTIQLNRGRVLEGIRTSFASARSGPRRLGASRYFPRPIRRRGR